jgi:hypothetical protein
MYRKHWTHRQTTPEAQPFASSEADSFPDGVGCGVGAVCLCRADLLDQPVRIILMCWRGNNVSNNQPDEHGN